MSHDPQGRQLSAFFAQLTWTKLEKRMVKALKRPEEEVPLKMRCPAVSELAQGVMGKIAETAIARPGEPVTQGEAFSYDTRVGVMRLLEAIVCEAEDWLESNPEGVVRAKEAGSKEMPHIPESPMMLEINRQRKKPRE